MTEATAAAERSLLDALSAGDRNAAWDLWLRNAPQLYALCLAEMAGHRADAEDALAQAMLKAVAQLPRFAAGIVSARAWLRRLTQNVCRDIKRERARLRIAEEAFELTGDGGGGAHHETDHYEPAVLVEQLPPRLREVFVLRVVQQLRYSEIAARLQLTPAAARKRVQQARRLVIAWRDGGMPPIVHAVREQPAPSRSRQKLSTLRAYVQRHPGGWKKRLALADLLYENGALAEAAESYRHVLRKRPWLTEVAQRIDEISRELEKFT